MKMTPKEAADWAGVSKSTVIRAIGSGKLSAKKNDEGVNLIDPSELERWNQSRSGNTASKEEARDAARTLAHETRRTPKVVRDDTAKDTGEARVLSVKVEMMQAQIDLLMSERDDLRQQRNEAQAKRDEAEARLTGVLTDQRAEKEPEQSKRRRWWQLAIIL
jgi:chromosome segregation ATPase